MVYFSLTKPGILIVADHNDYGQLNIVKPAQTFHLPFEHWTEVLGNGHLTGALLDRISHFFCVKRSLEQYPGINFCLLEVACGCLT